MAPSQTFGPLLRTVLEAIFEVFLMCLMGWILARQGVLDKKTQKQLNRINVSLFTPCLLFSKVAFSLSPAKLRELYIIPIFFVLVTAVSAAVAYTAGRLFGLKPSQRAFAIAASMFNNSNSLPIALMQSLVVTVKGLKWGSDDSKDAMLGRALGYLVLYSTLGMILRWSYGVHLLSQADDEVGPDGHPIVKSAASSPPFDAGNLPTTPTLVATPYEEPSPLLENESSSPDDSPIRSRLPRPVGRLGRAQTTLAPSAALVIDSRRFQGEHQTSRRFFHSFPNTPARSPSPTPIHTPRESVVPSSHYRDIEQGLDSDDDDGDAELMPDADHDEWGAQRPRTSSSTPSALSRVFRRIISAIVRFFARFREFMTAPLYAALASIIVALIPPLQHVMDEHVAPVKGFLNSAGSCSIPITLVVLGAYFYREPKLDAPPLVTATSPNGSHLSAVGGNGKRPAWVLGADAPNTNERSPLTANGGLHQGSGDYGSSPTGSRTSLHAQGGEYSPDPEEAISNGHARDPKRLSSMSLTTLAGSVKDALKMKSFSGSIGRAFGRSAGPIRLDDDEGSIQPKAEETAPGETKTVFVAIISRMVLTPLIILPMVALLAYFDVHQIFDDPVFVVSNVLLISAPPALTLAQITQAASGDMFERLISRTIFWAYCVFTPPLTLFYVVIGLYFSRL